MPQVNSESWFFCSFMFFLLYTISLLFYNYTMFMKLKNVNFLFLKNYKFIFFM